MQIITIHRIICQFKITQTKITQTKPLKNRMKINLKTKLVKREIMAQIKMKLKRNHSNKINK